MTSKSLRQIANESDFLDLDEDEWITLTRDDLPIHPPAHWTSVVALLQEEGYAQLKVIHNQTRLILTGGQVAKLQGMPRRMKVPSCPTCDVRMTYKTSRWGMFWACPHFPDCEQKIAGFDCLQVDD